MLRPGAVDGPAERSLDAHDQASGLWCEISFKECVLLEIRDLPTAPARFRLRFARAASARSNCMVYWAGASAGPGGGYDLGQSPAEEIERLRDYILQAIATPPRLHTQVSS
jgi:hypothetical protein